MILSTFFCIGAWYLALDSMLLWQFKALGMLKLLYKFWCYIWCYIRYICVCVMDSWRPINWWRSLTSHATFYLIRFYKMMHVMWCLILGLGILFCRVMQTAHSIGSGRKRKSKPDNSESFHLSSGISSLVFSFSFLVEYWDSI